MTKAKQHIDWQIPDPREMGPDEFRQVRDMIAAKVRELVHEVEL
jgi:protein-tyrosine-phosphatase